MLKPELTDILADSRDFLGLTRIVLEACAPYGPVHSLELVHNKRARRVSCLIELDSPKQQAALARELGAAQFGGTVCLEIPVRPDFALGAVQHRNTGTAPSRQPVAALA
jgi:hypothetical protein